MIADPMKKSLIIVESPTKAKTIGKYLPASCTVMASAGHVVELNPSPDAKKPGIYGVDTENGFALDYEIEPGKAKLLADMKKELKKVDQLILASDEDREGESIAWHLYNQLQPKVPVYRMVFHEITKKAITAAFENCRDIDMNLVMAQEARRAIDRLQGYGISPILSQKLGYKYSAGRVQSPALKLIVEKEKIRRAFAQSEYCSVDAKAENGKTSFAATLTYVGEEQIAVSKSFDSETGAPKKGYKLLGMEEASAIADEVTGADATVLSVNQTDKVEHPAMPFTTSTLQQDATRKMGKSAKEIMSIAQRLYENGFITYMRTDSPTLSGECIHAASAFIMANYGEELLQVRNYKAKSLGAQEAHEAIRPAGDHFRAPEETGLRGDELKLYSIIWKRTIATQMKDSIKAVTSVKMKCGDYTFAASGSVIKYEGFRKVYMVSSDSQEDEEGILPSLNVGDVVKFSSAQAKSHMTQPPQRYTEASLVQKLESEEIGRPSTYATIISTLLDRGYVVRQGLTLVPTFTGFFVDSFLEKAFSLYVGYDFTKNMEAGLDSIARGEEDKVQYLSSFWFGGEGTSQTLPGLSNDILDVKKTVRTGEAKSLQLPGLHYEFPHGEEIVHYEIKTGKFGPYIQADQKEGVNAKDMMRSIPATMYPGTFSDQDAEKLLYPESEPAKILFDKYEVKSGRYGEYLLRVEDQKSVSWPKSLKTKVENASEEMLDLVFSLPKELGADKDGNVAELRIGPYGFYASYNGKNIRILNPLTATFESVVSQEAPSSVKGELDGKPIELKSGKFGPYIKWGTENIPLSAVDKKNPSSLTLERIMEIASTHESKAAAAPAAFDKEFALSDGSKCYLVAGKYGPYLKWGSENVALPKDAKENPAALDDARINAIIEEFKAKPKTPSRGRRFTRK